MMRSTINKGSNPLPLSVVMPVHNGMPFFERAVESILSQSYSDFELIILDNGSTDGSIAVAERMHKQDNRIKLYVYPHPLGMVGSANAVIRKASAALIARMDADDLSHRDRLSRQIQTLQNHPEAVLVASLHEGIDANDRRVRPRDRLPLVRAATIAPFAHGSIMFRRAAFEEAGGYESGTDGYEDQDLYRRLATKGSLLVLPTALYKYRFHDTNWTSQVLNKVASTVYIPIAAQNVWSGTRAPRLPSLAMAKKVRLRTIRVVLYGSWGVIHPKSMRAFMAGWIRVRDFIAGAWFRNPLDTSPIRWHP